LARPALLKQTEHFGANAHASDLYFELDSASVERPHDDGGCAKAGRRTFVDQAFFPGMGMK
jgi:hypothetical protein